MGNHESWLVLNRLQLNRRAKLDVTSIPAPFNRGCLCSALLSRPTWSPFVRHFEKSGQSGQTLRVLVRTDDDEKGDATSPRDFFGAGMRPTSGNWVAHFSRSRFETGTWPPGGRAQRATPTSTTRHDGEGRARVSWPRSPHGLECLKGRASCSWESPASFR